ncbi:MAG: hypothetical protein HQL25_01050 [Candidatus Omnitrophica bacterium]|nr:hypothetical protein [Candidatus Omnitrophota bacterium]
MDKDEIYDHLAQVYLGKKRKSYQNNRRQKREFGAWLLINILITVLIFSGVFYGLTAFLTNRDLKSNIVYFLHNGSIRMAYDFTNPQVPSQIFTLNVKGVDAEKFGNLKFSIRAKDGKPGIVKVVVRNARGEEAYYYVQSVGTKWKEENIPLNQFRTISDWSTLRNVSFVLEAWNIDDKKGSILIDNLCFSDANLNGG